MPRARRVCSTPGCAALTEPGRSRCTSCTAAADRQRRPDGNPYASTAHRRGFRLAVLDRDPICVLCRLRLATIADHWPIERRDLVAAGLDPDDPERGRGLCKPCHDRSTATRTPGGWAAGL